MKAKGYLFLVLMFTLPCAIFAQKVKIMDMSKDYFHHEGVEGFSYLHEDLENNDAFYWIADLKVEFDTIFPHSITQIYRRFLVKANKLGANAFRVESSDLYTFGDEKFVQVKTYFLRQERRKENRALFFDNTVRLFGFLGHHQDIDGYNIAINDEKILLTELRFKELTLHEGDHVHIKMTDGMRGGEVEFTITEHAIKKYYYFEMFHGLMTKGKISEYNWSFGEMLARILRKEKLEINKS